MYLVDFSNKKPTHHMLKEVRHLARLSIEDAAEFCGIHRTSYGRQEAGDSRVSCSCYRLLLMIAGWLPGEFSGWRIGQGKLWTPEDVSYEPGEIRAIPYLYAIIADYERELGIPNRSPAVAENVVPLRRKEK